MKKYSPFQFNYLYSIQTLSFFLIFCLFFQTPQVYSQNKVFTIKVIDIKTGRGIPMVELRTPNALRYFSDSNGIISFSDPTLINRQVNFDVFSQGYLSPGMVGINTKEGTDFVLKLKRNNIAEPLYRITGQDIYGESVKSGYPVPIKNQALNGNVLGQDTFIETLYKGKIYWFWGDTILPDGFNGKASGATSELPGKGGLDPSDGIDLTYFVNDHGSSKAMCPYGGETLVWIQWLAVMEDENKEERLYATYVCINRDGKEGESGFAIFNDSAQYFENIKVVDEWYGYVHRIGHPFPVRSEGNDYFYIINYNGIQRFRPDYRHLTDPKSYEQFSCFAPGSLFDTTLKKPERDLAGSLVYGWKSNTAMIDTRDQLKLVEAGEIKPEEGIWQLRDILTGKEISLNPSSVFWNEYRKRWIMLAYEFTGGVWFFEADTPTGPWVYGRKILKYQNYDFYNIGQHRLFDQDGGRLIYFEGTYTVGFSGSKDKTPLYDYNQMMYRLALDDKRLVLPAPVYLVSHDQNRNHYMMRDSIISQKQAENILSIPFFAIPGEIVNDNLIPVYVSTSEDGQILSTSKPQSSGSDILFYALPASDVQINDDPVSGTWKIKALMPDSSEVELEIVLENEDEIVCGTYVTNGYFKNNILELELRIFDYTLSGSTYNEKLTGKFRKDDGTKQGTWSGIRVKALEKEEESSSVVFLYEYYKTDSRERFYSVDPDLENEKFIREREPICRVWRNPMTVLPLDFDAKPVQFFK